MAVVLGLLVAVSFGSGGGLVVALGGLALIASG
jgi:hypothetical protein